VLVEEFGLEGYGRWFRLLETVGKKMERGSDRCHVEYTETKWCEILKVKRKKLNCFLVVIQKELKTNVERNGNKLRIECPNLLKKRDEYTEKSRHSPNNILPKSKEVRSKKEEEHNITLGGENSENRILSKKDYAKFFNRFETIWGIYPHKMARHKALEAFFAHVRSEGMEYYRELAFAVRCEQRAQWNATVQDIQRSPPPGYIFFGTGYKDYSKFYKTKKIPASYEKPYK